MIKPIQFVKSLWQLQIIKAEIAKGNRKLAQHLILARKKQGYKLTLLERLFLENQGQTKQNSDYLPGRTATIARQKFTTQQKLIQKINSAFHLIDHDGHKIECTGIEESIFTKLETELVIFLEKIIDAVDLNKNQVKQKIKEAYRDLNGLKKGIDPTYDKAFSPHVYFIKYFLDNVYCSYLAYFFIYQSGQLKRNLKILDIAAGPATMLFGLSLFLESLADYQEIANFTCSYYSLEKQRNLQYRGLQFWRQYLDSLKLPPNIFYQFNTVNIFDYDNYSSKLPRGFFDLIIIAHCFFYQGKDRSKSFDIYRSIFKQCLRSEGRVLLVVQGNKFYKMFDTYPDENIDKERYLIDTLLDSLGLQLIFYKYLTSTGKRTSSKENFKKFILGNLPEQPQMDKVKWEYLNYKNPSKYVIDDFVIYAERQF
ncbi:hypothetical protein IQE94_01200 [Synechocystis sp. PCC 7339]|uniref:Slr0286 family photosystem II assembly protein n=1 Tax=Synechocystis sp. PCC 7339 TaxID=2782213 RepID=UPI001CBF3ED8|nr:hypothetical protein [Synechocystis sp. PCC 7339]UAJ73002.1 hypothetical protein IQE94_01200 [Synechocystis sp. PCC 7339]